MSPFCRTCLGIAREGETRCPKDGEFYLKRSCEHCQAELFPRELFCAECGAEMEFPDEAVLVPGAAPWPRVTASLFLDMVCGSLVVTMAASLSVLAVVIGLVLSFVYRVIGRAGGRQTLGQAVFQLISVNENAAPLSLLESLRRTILELGLWPLALIKPQQADQKIEAITRVYEVRLV